MGTSALGVGQCGLQTKRCENMHSDLCPSARSGHMTDGCLHPESSQGFPVSPVSPVAALACCPPPHPPKTFLPSPSTDTPFSCVSLQFPGCSFSVSVTSSPFSAWTFVQLVRAFFLPQNHLPQHLPCFRLPVTGSPVGAAVPGAA